MPAIKYDMTSEMLLLSLCELLNGGYTMIIETKKDQDIIHFGDKILTRDSNYDSKRSS